MKKRTIRTASVIAAVLLVGTVAFAAAQTVQPLPPSQIPVVVTTHPALEVSATVPSDAATKVAPIATPAPVVTSPKAASATGDNSGSSTRELVTPKMRDDSGADNSGGSSDGHSDNTDSGTSTNGGVRDTTAPTRHQQGSDTNEHKSNVQQEHSSGNN